MIRVPLGSLRLICLLGLLLGLGSPIIPWQASAQTSTTESPWWGHDFVFCFITDDGTGCNESWAELALAMDFRFTMAVNVSTLGIGKKLTTTQLAEYAASGFEITNHANSHAQNGMTACLDAPDCLIGDPFLGDLRGYFQKGYSFTRWEDAKPFFLAEICRDSLLAAVPGLSGQSTAIRTFVYPGTGHTKQIVRALVIHGYLGARIGTEYRALVVSDYTTLPCNGWDEGISLFRVPALRPTPVYFGDHSDDPPVFHDYDTFLANSEPAIVEIRARRGIFVLYAHHWGDIFDCHSGGWGYSHGGVMPYELGWMVDLVRANNGIVKTFGEAVRYYRERTECQVVDGDYIWAPGVAREPSPRSSESLLALGNHPNPFNPQTMLTFSLPSDGYTRLTIHDLTGRQLRTVLTQQMSAGKFFRIWDGTDAGGRPVASGVYTVRLEQHGTVSTRKINLLR